MPDVRRQFGARVRQLRKKRGLSQAGLADLIDCDKRLIIRYEKGRALPRLERQYALAAALGVDWRDLICPTGDEERPRKLPADVLEVALFVERQARKDPGFPVRALRLLRSLAE